MIGYSRDYILKCLNNNDLNQATTCYHIFANAKLNENDNDTLQWTSGQITTKNANSNNIHAVDIDQQ